MTIQDAYKLFVHNRKVYCSDKTLKTYDGAIQLFFKYLENTFESRISEMDINQEINIYQEYIIDMRNRKNSRTGLYMRPVTIRSYCRTIKAFLKWCYENDMCRDYMKGVKLPKNDARPKMPLYQDEVKNIDDTLNKNTILGKRNYCIIHLMLDCGLRTEEVVHLQVNHILPDKNIIQIIDSKGNKSRMTLIPNFLIDAITDYKTVAHIYAGLMFLGVRSGEPITGNTIKQMFQDLKKSSGVLRVHAHLLRHTFATSYLIGGGNLEFLRVFMGHTDYAVTQMYSQMAAEYKMLGADIYRLDSIFFTKGY